MVLDGAITGIARRPNVTARNKILPLAATVVALTLQAPTAASVNTQEWLNTSAAVVASVDKDGKGTFANLTLTGFSGVLKAAAGVVAGSATTSDVPEGSNLYYTDERVDDRVAALLVAGSGISLTYSDVAGTLTVASTVTQYTDEMAQDAAATLIQNGTGISWSYNDALNTLTPTVTLAPFTTTNLAQGSNLYYTDALARAAITGTANRITVTTGVVDISAAYVGQASITTLGTIATGTWQGTSIATTYTDAKVKTATGTANRLTIGGTATDPTFDISTSYVGQNTITTLGTIGTGVWQGTAVAVLYGGTGATTAAGARTNLNLVIGTDVQAFDAELAAIAGLTSAADKLPYFTGSGTASLADFTSFARTLVDDASATAARTTLGVGTGDSPSLTGLTLSGLAAAKVLFTGTGGLVSVGNLFWDASNTYLGIGAAGNRNLDISMAASGSSISARINNTSNTASSTTQLQMESGGSSAQEASILFTYTGLTSTARWSIGRAHSSGHFIIAQSSALTSSAQFAIDIDNSQNVEISIGNLTAAKGDFKISTAGKGIYIKEGSNATMGVVTLVLGTATISTTKVTANSRIFLCSESLGTITSPVAIGVTARTAGTSFTITSANLTDTSTVAWVILEPA